MTITQFISTSNVTLIHQTKPTTINYGTIHKVDPKPIPEPLTILGSATAMGFGTFFKRKIGKKLQQEKA
jgi:hypothetical protein